LIVDNFLIIYELKYGVSRYIRPRVNGYYVYIKVGGYYLYIGVG